MGLVEVGRRQAHLDRVGGEVLAFDYGLFPLVVEDDMGNGGPSRYVGPREVGGVKQVVCRCVARSRSGQQGAERSLEKGTSIHMRKSTTSRIG